MKQGEVAIIIRIGIVGSDNTHAYAFAKIVNVEQKYGSAARVIAICGTDPARTEEVRGKAQIDEVVESPEAMLGKVDAAIVVNRHGDLHLAGALPFLKRGLPVFIDKPLACKLEDCHAIIAAANQSGAKLMSFSTVRYNPSLDALEQEMAGIGDLRYAAITGPGDFDSVYGGPFFYGNHCLEAALRLCGEDVTQVRTVRSGKNVVATLTFAAGHLANVTYLADYKGGFHAQVAGSNALLTRPLESAGGYSAGMDIFMEMLQTGKRPLSDEQILKPLRIIHAMIRSIAQSSAPVDLESVR